MDPASILNLVALAANTAQGVLALVNSSGEVLKNADEGELKARITELRAANEALEASLLARLDARANET